MRWVKVGQCRAEALFKKQQQLHDGQQAKAEYQPNCPLCSKGLRECGAPISSRCEAEDNPVKRTHSGLTLRTSHTTINSGRVVVRSFSDTSY
jgi:hypothetical protein